MKSVDVKDLGKIAVVMGGSSGEREVSLMSGSGVLKALQSVGADVVKFDPAEQPLSDLAGIDRAFLILHGKGGEDGVIQGVKIIDQHETEGIGTNVVSDEAFLSQFAGKTAGDLSIDVVAGATFTSEGILSGCQKAAELFSSLQSEILG